MPSLADVKGQAQRLLAGGGLAEALRLYDSVVAAAPLDYEARLKVADCLAGLGESRSAVEVYRAVGWFAVRSGHPLLAIVILRILESVGAEAADLAAALVANYGSESERLGRLGARLSLPPGQTEVAVPDLRAPAAPDLPAQAARRAKTCLDDFDGYPEALHRIPLLSELSRGSLERVLATLVARRLPARELVIREGEPGQSFFFVAAGEVRVVRRGERGNEEELARLKEGALFGEMALLSARPRIASVEVVGEADLLEVTRASLAAVAGELDQVAAALERFKRERLLGNLMAHSPLFRPFSRVHQRDLLRRFTSHDVAAGTEIIHQGDAGRGLFVILSGEVAVEVEGESGKRTPLATLRSGEVFGEMALIRGGPTSATVTASTPATVLFLGRENVERIVAGVAEIRRYLEELAQDRELDTRLALQEEPGEDDVIILI